MNNLEMREAVRRHVDFLTVDVENVSDKRFLVSALVSHIGRAFPTFRELHNITKERMVNQALDEIGEGK